jgi:hypothetical protein
MSCANCSIVADEAPMSALYPAGEPAIARDRQSILTLALSISHKRCRLSCHTV